MFKHDLNEILNLKILFNTKLFNIDRTFWLSFFGLLWQSKIVYFVRKKKNNCLMAYKYFY